MSQLDQLEHDSVFILREAFNKLERLGMLWSIGKDSTVLLWLARKAFLGHVPFPLVHVDTAYKLPGMIAYRDQLVRDWKLNLIVGQNTEALKQKLTFPEGNATRVECCSRLKRDALAEVIRRHEFTGVLVGVRRDEEPTRAKERYFSLRGPDMAWNVGEQPPEIWGHFNTDCAPGSHLRVHPLLHWTEADIWDYIQREDIPVSPLYFAGATGERFRSLGCWPCTASVTSQARTVAEIAAEVRATRVSERAGRAQDAEAEDAFERLRREGYM